MRGSSSTTRIRIAEKYGRCVAIAFSRSSVAIYRMFTGAAQTPNAGVVSAEVPLTLSIRGAGVGQENPEAIAAGSLRLDVHASAMERDGPSHDGEAESAAGDSSAPGRGCPVEPIEHSRTLLRIQGLGFVHEIQREGVRIS